MLFIYYYFLVLWHCHRISSSLLNYHQIGVLKGKVGRHTSHHSRHSLGSTRSAEDFLHSVGEVWATIQCHAPLYKSIVSLHHVTWEREVCDREAFDTLYSSIKDWCIIDVIGAQPSKHPSMHSFNEPEVYLVVLEVMYYACTLLTLLYDQNYSWGCSLTYTRNSTAVYTAVNAQPILQISRFYVTKSTEMSTSAGLPRRILKVTL